MNIPEHRLELKSRNSNNKFNRFPSRFSLSQSGFKNQVLATLRSRLAPSILMENRLESLPNDESANREDKKGTNGI